MKIAFVTDTHFGYRRFEKEALEQGREAILSAAREADLLILGGDNFDTPLPRMETIAEVTTILREALEIFRSRGITGTPILAIHGNHDRSAKGFVHPTELLAQGGFVQNFHNRTVLFERNREKVAVSGMGSVPEDLAAESLKQVACKPITGAFNIFVVHQSFQEFDRMKNEDYIAFDDLPEVESGQRGWLLYDTTARRAEFKPIKSRQLYHKILKFENAQPEEIRKAVEAEVKGALSAGSGGAPEPLVKIVVKGTLAQGFHTQDLRLPEFGENVFIDNAMNSENLRERIAQIKQSREKKISAKELGIQLLRKNLEWTAYSLGDPERLFESLIEGVALKEIKERIEKAKAD